jgi:Protein of unknown function (DUF3455)
MSKTKSTSFAIFATVLTVCAGCAPSLSAPKVPSELVPASSNQAFLKLTGRGVQVYTCQAKADKSGHEWAFKSPLADLYDDAGNKVGTHGAGPFWQHQDGSRIVGEVKARTNSTDATAIPWLLLGVKSSEGIGVLSKTSYVQRLETLGGKAPAMACDASTNLGEESRVVYSATYVYFRSK